MIAEVTGPNAGGTSQLPIWTSLTARIGQFYRWLMGALEKMPVVREGVWLYEQSVPVHIRILSSPETWGTGDYEDEDAISENQPIPCFFLAYEGAGSPGDFCNIVPNLASFEAAIAYAERAFPGIKWNES